jgi:hypothetical protein
MSRFREFTDCLSAEYQAELGGLLWGPAFKLWLQKPTTLTESLLLCCLAWRSPPTRIYGQGKRKSIYIHIYSPSALHVLL